MLPFAGLMPPFAGLYVTLRQNATLHPIAWTYATLRWTYAALRCTHAAIRKGTRTEAPRIFNSQRHRSFNFGGSQNWIQKGIYFLFKPVLNFKLNTERDQFLFQKEWSRGPWAVGTLGAAQSPRIRNFGETSNWIQKGINFFFKRNEAEAPEL